MSIQIRAYSLSGSVKAAANIQKQYLTGTAAIPIASSINLCWYPIKAPADDIITKRKATEREEPGA
jgi:hypothetical protein